MENNLENSPYLYKLLSLFSVVRGYNVMTLSVAQYLASIFIFSPEKSLRHVLLDGKLFFIVLSSACVVAAGYIINNFYDKERDLINRPVKSSIDNLVSQNTQLNIYFLLNFIGILLGFLVSWKAVLFFSGYIFLIWFYSHKLKRYPIIGWLSAAVVTILPFFAIFVYYKNFSEVIFIHAIFLFLLLLIRELVKSLENMNGDILTNYQSIPIKYGVRFTKVLSTILSVLILIPLNFLWQYPEIGLMKFYFLVTIFLLLVFVSLLWNSTTSKRYIFLHNVLKFLIFAGIFSLILMDTSLIVSRLI
jgi:4-hydroxybenzoate polyprenyltransferase